ncbi:uncharacterized protein LOC108146529 [Drosophila elegans]|uniref:uncharacterized protein LOC108146529 n=1 Tax=Drosophila elegans TaxID=30023 RepID=UPI0007E82F95|nr:uncharacterized protein LOC108146529 [Drosophila elegans]
MDESNEFILNSDCLLEILNYVIADCKSNFTTDRMLKYNDLINFVLSHEFFLESHATYHKLLYEELELAIACRITKILIDLRVNRSAHRNEPFWISLQQSIREKNPFDVELSLNDVCIRIDIKGLAENLSYSEEVEINVDITAETLADICILNPNLRKLTLDGTKIHRILSEIAPHCESLEELEIYPDPELGAAPYASLAKLPNLKTCTFSRVQENTSKFFNDFREWHRPKSLEPSTLAIEYHVGEITFATFDSLQSLHTYISAKHPYDYIFKVQYDLREKSISKSSNSIEESLATITFDENVFIKFDKSNGELQLKPLEESDISKMGSLSKLPNLSRLVIDNKGVRLPSLAKFLRFMVPKGSFALKYCSIKNPINKFSCIELAKISSIRFLACRISECSLLKYINQLTNLEHLVIKARDSFDRSTLKLISNLLNKCKVQATLCCQDFSISLKKNEKELEIELGDGCRIDVLTPLAQLKDVKSLHISTILSFKGSLNPLFKAFASSKLCAIEELVIVSMDKLRFEDVSSMADIKTIKKLVCSLSNCTGIEKLASLNNLEELRVFGKGNLAQLFTKLAEKNVIQKVLHFTEIVPEELIALSRIGSLKKLQCYFSEMQDLQALSELANSSIEKLVVHVSRSTGKSSLQNLFAAISSNSSARLQSLKIEFESFQITEMAEVSKIQGLKKLKAEFCNSECAQLLVRLPNLEHLEIKNYNENEIKLENTLRDLVLKPQSALRKLKIKIPIGFNECKYLSQIETLESLACNLRDEVGIEVLADIKKLKELNIDSAKGSLSGLFRAFANNRESTLQELNTQIRNSDEICEITKIKSLKKLFTFNDESTSGNFSDLSQLTELDSLHIKSTSVNFSDLSQLTELESLHIRISDPFEMHKTSLLPIFQSCQKLECVRLSFGDMLMETSELVSNAYTILKSIRDPALQKPLKLVLDVSTFPKFHVQDIDEAFLNVCYKSWDPFYFSNFDFDFENSDVDDLDFDDLDYDDSDVDDSDIDNSDVDDVDVDNSDVDNSDIDKSDVDTSDVDNSDIDSSDVDSSDVDKSDVDTSDVDKSDIDSSDVDSLDVDKSDIDNSDVDDSDVDDLDYDCDVDDSD